MLSVNTDCLIWLISALRKTENIPKTVTTRESSQFYPVASTARGVAVFVQTGDLLAALEPLHSFDQRVPAEYDRDAESVHLKIFRIAVVDGRHVAKGSLDVVVDVISERVSKTDIVQLLPSTSSTLA